MKYLRIMAYVIMFSIYMGAVGLLIPLVPIYLIVSLVILIISAPLKGIHNIFKRRLGYDPLLAVFSPNGKDAWLKKMRQEYGEKNPPWLEPKNSPKRDKKIDS